MSLSEISNVVNTPYIASQAHLTDSLKSTNIVKKFMSTASAIENNISDLRKLPIGEDLSNLEKGVARVYDQIQGLKVMTELFSKSARKVHNTARAQVIEAHALNKISELEKGLSDLHLHLIQDGKLKLISDKTDKFMWEVLRARRNLVATDYPVLMEKWKGYWKELLNINHEANKFKLKTPGVESKINWIAGQLTGFEQQIINTKEFHDEPSVRLARVLRMGAPSSEELEVRKAQIDELISNLSPYLQERIDYFVYLFSAEPKGGDNWGKHHRFDNFEVLKKAFGSAYWDHIKINMPKTHGFKESSFSDALDARFYNLCKQNTGETHVSKVSSNAQANFIGKNVQFDTGKKDFVQSRIMHQPVNLSKSFWFLAGREVFQTKVNGYVTPLPDYSAEFDIVSELAQEKSELEKARDLLSVVCHSEEVDDGIKKEYISAARLLEALSESQRNKIEGHVYDLSTDPSKGGEAWGKHHAYDDPKVLFNAVERLVSTKA